MCALDFIWGNVGGDSLPVIALNTAMIMPVLVLQRPHKSKNNDHIHHLTHRPSLYIQGDIDTLVSEGRVLQHQFSKFRKNKSTLELCTSNAQKISQFMLNGKVKDTLQLLSSHCSNVMELLIRKHPKK